MKLNPSRGGINRKALVRGLLLCCAFTLLLSLAFSLWFSMTRNVSSVINPEDIEMIQLEEPKTGDQIAVMHTDAGDMTYVLYPDYAPETVANFCKLAESGYYDGSYVFRVEPEIFFSAGAPNSDGTVPNPDADSERIPRELSAKLWPLRGALCALTTKADAGFFRTLTGRQRYYTGSRFLVADTIEMTDEIREGLLSQTDNESQDLVANAFLEKGGIPNYSQQIAVFGQLIEGYDILDSITGSELTGSENAMRPKDDIRILSIEIGTFGEK
jgi:peptidyl-prolyl cis-trans isomerase B (cyclophilin B)